MPSPSPSTLSSSMTSPSPRATKLLTVIAWNHPAFERPNGPTRRRRKLAENEVCPCGFPGGLPLTTATSTSKHRRLKSSNTPLKGKLSFGLGDATIWQEDKILQEIERLRPITKKQATEPPRARLYLRLRRMPRKFPIIEKCAQALKRHSRSHCHDHVYCHSLERTIIQIAGRRPLLTI